jgi:hypothetical protein
MVALRCIVINSAGSLVILSSITVEDIEAARKRTKDTDN